MKLLVLSLITYLSISTSAFAAEIDDEESREIIILGEVIGSRAFLKPNAGFELVIRYDQKLYYCSVGLDRTFSGDQMIRAQTCFDETNNID
ncbi:hypothetical protein [Thalassovita mediterranea]|uniref:hypothetical protein n=1 Tax=Thalassovita mediterranea TaxID=340021 RepID=UPI00117DEE50|nr:hypothetical protein [Thalassovita mediterranea]